MCCELIPTYDVINYGVRKQTSVYVSQVHNGATEYWELITACTCSKMCCELIQTHVIIQDGAH